MKQLGTLPHKKTAARGHTSNRKAVDHNVAFFVRMGEDKVYTDWHRSYDLSIVLLVIKHTRQIEANMIIIKSKANKTKWAGLRARIAQSWLS